MCTLLYMYMHGGFGLGSETNNISSFLVVCVFSTLMNQRIIMSFHK